MTETQPFWRRKTLDAMTRSEWESLCDGCGRCCLIKLENEEDRRIAYTRVACRLLDSETCRCRDYARRSARVPGCVALNPRSIRDAAGWMPETCAYRLVAEGRPLPDWHPLVSGDPESVHRAGVSVRGWTVPETEVDEDDFENHVVPGLR